MPGPRGPQLLSSTARGLIAALVGAAAAGLLVVAVLAALIVAPLASRALAIGPRLPRAVPIPAAALASAWTIALGAGALGVDRLFAALQHERGMTAPLRAL